MDRSFPLSKIIWQVLEWPQKHKAIFSGYCLFALYTPKSILHVSLPCFVPKEVDLYAQLYDLGPLILWFTVGFDQWKAPARDQRVA